MNILYSSLHQIDYINDRIITIDIKGTSSSLEEYILKLITEITTKPNVRKFRFASNTSEVRATIDKYLQQDFANASVINATRLLKIEKQTQEKITKLQKEVQKGSLLQAFIENGAYRKIIISKAEHSAFLDDVDLLLHQGLPWEKRIFKAVIIDITKSNTIGGVTVFDTNTPMAVYWWREFLELSEVYNDSYNTHKALAMIDMKVFDPIKYTHPADHTLLRNSTIKYFRSNTGFDLQGYTDVVFGGYQPVDPNLSVDDLIDRIAKLPEKWDFDPSFGIMKEEITKRMVENKIPLAENIDLILSDHIENLESIIVPDKEVDGKKFIKIYSEQGYERFKKRE